MKKQKTVSIKAKLLGVIIPVVIAIVVVLVVAAYQISSGTIIKYSQNLLQSSVENQASQIEAWLNENLASFQMAKTIIEDLKPSDEELKTILDGYYGYNSNYPEGLYVADSTGQLITASESTKKESDVTNSTWYKEGLTRVNMAVGSAYQNADGVNVISASGILNDGSDKVRVISADMTLDRIAIIVNSFIEMNDAEAFLVDKTSGVILANRDSSLISQTLGAEGQSHFYQLTAEKAAEKDYNFEFVEDAELLAKYNEVNYTSYKFLPAEQYNFKGKEAVIKQGEVLSESSGLEILPLTQEMKDSGNKYAIALTLQSKDGTTEVLKPGSTILYLLDPAIVTSVPVFNSRHNVAFSLIEDLSLSEWTLEFCVNMSKLGKKVGELNNQALFDGSSSLGESDGQIYTRFGDAPIEGNRLQIKTQGLQMNSATLFEEDKWYQIAWVCTSSKLYLYVDGKLDNSIDVPGKVTNLSKTKCKIGNTEYLKADVQMSEFRLWKRALSQREIANNLYATDPHSNALFAYFKFNEGKGDRFTDATGNGNEAWCIDPVEWRDNVRLNANN